MGESYCSVYFSVDELGPPSISQAIKPNRMSPAGIPMFYGSLDEDTVIEEMKIDDVEFVTLIAFKTLKDIKVLDLSNLPDIPSLFDQEKNYLRSGIIFMRSFVDDLSKPIINDGREHIEYVPTQIVTEFFRHIFRDEYGEVILGIFYPSSRNASGTSCVLFIQKENCIQDDINRKFEFPWQEVEAVLSMDSSSRKIIKINP